MAEFLRTAEQYGICGNAAREIARFLAEGHIAYHDRSFVALPRELAYTPRGIVAEGFLRGLTAGSDYFRREWAYVASRVHLPGGNRDDRYVAGVVRKVLNQRSPIPQGSHPRILFEQGVAWLRPEALEKAGRAMGMSAVYVGGTGGYFGFDRYPMSEFRKQFAQVPEEAQLLVVFDTLLYGYMQAQTPALLKQISPSVQYPVVRNPM